MRPLLSLVMIVKNEANGIEQTLKSILPACDTATILDTGSTDDTRAIVARVFAELNKPDARLIEGQFHDFATTRNDALDADMHLNQPVFQLMLSGDEIMHGADALRLFCASNREVDAFGCYHIQTHFHGLVFDSPRLMWADKRPRYVGKVHEYIESPGGCRVPGVHMVHERVDHDRAMSRFYKDLEVLQGELKRDPSPRNLFYYAQTLDCLGLYDAAASAYQKRIEVQGWFEERNEAMHRRAGCLWRSGTPWAQVMDAYLQAHQHLPCRAEPLYQIANRYIQTEEWAIAYVFARRAVELPMPQGLRIFLDIDTYEWRCLHAYAVAAWYVGDRREGHQAIERAYSRRPGVKAIHDCLMWYRGEAKNPQPGKVA